MALRELPPNVLKMVAENPRRLHSPEHDRATIVMAEHIKLTAGRLFDKMTSHLDSNGVAGFYEVMVIDYTDNEKGNDLRVENHEIDGHRYDDDFPDDS